MKDFANSNFMQTKEKLNEYFDSLDYEDILRGVHKYFVVENGKPGVIFCEEDIEEIEYCMYRSDDGGMCAVGCLIPDELYDECIEQTSPYSWLNDKNKADFLGELQGKHDDLCEDMETFHENFGRYISDLAERMNVTLN